jgi:hypothetical protein
VMLAPCPCSEVLAIVGVVILAGVRPLAMSLYEARTHIARFLVLCCRACVSISAGMPFDLKAAR